jgi:hypothetical protein
MHVTVLDRCKQVQNKLEGVVLAVLLYLNPQYADKKRQSEKLKLSEELGSRDESSCEVANERQY